MKPKVTPIVAKIVHQGIKRYAQREGEPGRLTSSLKEGLSTGLELALKDPEVQEFTEEQVAEVIGDGVHEIHATVSRGILETRQPETLDLHDQITNALITPEDGIFKRLFKSVFARFLNLGVNLSGFVAAGWLSRWTGLTREDEKQQARWFVSKHLSEFFNILFGNNLNSRPTAA